MYEYTLVANDKVFDVINKGADVLCVDFNTMRVLECNDVFVASLVDYVSRKDVVFYSKELTRE